MSTPKTPVPQDRKTKATEKELPTVEISGVTYTATQHPEVFMRRTGTIRKLTRLDEMDATFFMAESLLPPEAMEAADELDIEEFGKVLEQLLGDLDLGE